jgi:hypothetical protein
LDLFNFSVANISSVHFSYGSNKNSMRLVSLMKGDGTGADFIPTEEHEGIRIYKLGFRIFDLEFGILDLG